MFFLLPVENKGCENEKQHNHWKQVLNEHVFQPIFLKRCTFSKVRGTLFCLWCHFIEFFFYSSGFLGCQDISTKLLCQSFQPFSWCYVFPCNDLVNNSRVVDCHSHVPMKQTLLPI